MNMLLQPAGGWFRPTPCGLARAATLHRDHSFRQITKWGRMYTGGGVLFVI